MERCTNGQRGRSVGSWWCLGSGHSVGWRGDARFGAGFWWGQGGWGRRRHSFGALGLGRSSVEDRWMSFRHAWGASFRWRGKLRWALRCPRNGQELFGRWRRGRGRLRWCFLRCRSALCKQESYQRKKHVNQSINHSINREISWKISINYNSINPTLKTWRKNKAIHAA